MSKLYYKGTNIEVQLGDVVKFKKLFKEVKGEVVYLPGQSKINKSFGSDMWCIQLEDEPNDVRSMGFFPEQDPYALRRISFLGRGEGSKLISESENFE